MRALAVNRQVAAVTNAPVGLNFNQAADIHLDLFAKIAFHAAFLLDDRADAVHFVLGELADLFRGIHIRLFGDGFRAHLPDAIDRGQPDPKALLRRKINTCDTCHSFSCPSETCIQLLVLSLQFQSPELRTNDHELKTSLSLALLVLRVGADYPNDAAAMGHLALVTNFLDACPYFHADCSSRGPEPAGATSKLATWPPEGGRYKINLVISNKF